MTATPSSLEKSQEEYPFPAHEIQRLNARKWILRHAKIGGIGAEIGVFRGHFSDVLLNELEPKKLYLIDPWRKLGQYFDFKNPYTCDGKLPTQIAYDEVVFRAAKHASSEVVVIEGFFLEEAHKIEEKLDWIYLDASHKYDSTLAELHATRELLKPGGVIIGDDWSPDPASPHHGVFRAIHEYVKATNSQIVAAGPSGQYCIREALKY
jgi:hypothetical protein